MKVPFSYLDRQFADLDAYLADVREFVLTGQFTLGARVEHFEKQFAALCQMPYAIGVGSGTDALLLSLQIHGIGRGDEVITAANTFIATVGAIAMTGATPVFVDNDDTFTIDPTKLEAAITPRTKAIIPVHYTGSVAHMPQIMPIAEKHNLLVIEDACQSIMGRYDDLPVGSWGATAAFSLHPLKNLNVWGDGGMIVTRSAELNEKLRMFRNHGMQDRDTVAFYGHNSRLDALQAVIGTRLIGETEFITRQRIANAAKLDAALQKIPQIRVPARLPNVQHVYHLYVIWAEQRDELLKYLQGKGIQAKIHYPIPMHLQPAAQGLGYKEGDFPNAERDSKTSITLPVHQHLTEAELDYMIETITAFYKGA